MSKATTHFEIERSKDLLSKTEFVLQCSIDDREQLKKILAASEDPITAKNINDIIEGRLLRYQEAVGVKAVENTASA